ncbi:hypothetical protein FHN55_13935 [Streptomyces sp. NP160]|uniref:hypothetical protein n=1 Tax=Streptomyces sp. NP160 TaxID=2586637 RepID=UPI00111BCB2B|nr:hypothetical protein [Streptomyces sp. NP160]TNM64601.1 hypothetical protein FHN55_13935 [Streptomyces sp. NP160]
MSTQHSDASSSTPAAGEPLLSPVWVLRGIGNDPGYLVAAGGRLVLVAEHDDGPAFDVGLGELTDVQWPWWWFGGGFKGTVRGTRYKISFVRPNGAPGPDRGLLTDLDHVLVGHTGHGLSGLVDVAEGKAQARLWREVLPG